MSVWDDIDMNGLGSEYEPNEKLEKLLKRSHGQLVNNYMSSVRGKGRKLTEEAKQKLSKAKKGMVFTKEHKESLEKAKLKHKISKEQILEANSKFEFNSDRAKYMGMTVNTFKSIAKHHGVYQTNDMESMGRINGMKAAHPILVWKYNKETESKGEFIGEFPSVKQANGVLDTTGSALSKVARGECKQAKGYYAEFKKK